MNDIREWAIMLCSVSVGSVFIAFLIPDGNMKKSVNFVISLFLMTISIIPVWGKDSIKFDFPDVSVDKFPDEEEYLIEYSEFLQSFGEEEVQSQISELLEKECVNSYDINIESYFDTAGNIVVSDVKIILSSDDAGVVEKVKTDVKNYTGIVPQVVIDN